MVTTQGRLQGKKGIVTGGCGPLGRVVTSKLAAEGAHVIAVDLVEQCAEADLGDISHPQSGSIDTYSCDLLSDQRLEEFCRDVIEGSLNFIVHNAAMTGDSGVQGYLGAVSEQGDEAFDRALALNLSVPFKLTKRLLPALERGSPSAVVNVASIYGLVSPDFTLYSGTNRGTPAGYAASKGGLIQLTRYLAGALAPTIRVNAVAPGGIERGQGEHFVDSYNSRTPLGRMATENDVANSISWLLSDEASYITGHVLAVDGGWTVT